MSQGGVAALSSLLRNSLIEIGTRHDRLASKRTKQSRRETMLGVIDRENPYTRMIIQQKVDKWLENLPAAIASIGATAKLFTTLTGMTQASLAANWDGKDGVRGTKDDGRMTSCNSFAGLYSIAILGSKLKFGLAMFDLKGAMEKIGIPHAWKTQADNIASAPGYGDLVRWNRLHAGVSLGFDDGKWHTIEGGKGGHDTKFDAIQRVTYDNYPLSDILGWVDFTVIYDHEA